MAIYRGTGGAGDSTNDATVTEVTQQAVIASNKASEAAASATQAANSSSSASSSATAAASSAASAASAVSGIAVDAAAAEAAKLAAQAAQAAAELAETGAETAETNAETANTNAASSANSASTSATNAANSASSAATSASNASTSASAASTSASSAAASATAAADHAGTATTQAAYAAISANSASNSATAASSSASAASTSATNAATAETNAATSETNAATSAANASTSETNASASEAAAAGSAASASTSASNAATSATSASNSASAASTSATNAAASETAAAGSASAASASADAALAALDNFDDRYLGQKASAPTVDNDGDPLVTGALYFDTTDDAMKVWDGTQWLNAYASLSGALIATNNLSDLTNAATARTNLGLGTAATTDSTAYATAAQGALADAALPASSYTAADVLTKVKTVDGSGSGLDADLLDGQQGTYYAAASSLSSYLPKANNSDYQLKVWDNRGTDTSTDLGQQAAVFEFKQNTTDSLFDGGVYHGVLTLQQWGDPSGGNTHQLAFTDNGNLHLRSVAIGGTWPTNWSKIWHSGNDGAGSGLDADLLDGQQGTYYAAASSLSNYLPLTGGAITGDATFGDNNKATFGASGDLQIYHSGSNSFVKDVGQGNLLIDTNGSLAGFTSDGVSKYMALFNKDASVDLYYNNSKKLATTSTGIDVTGTVTADGLTVGADDIIQFGTTDNTGLYRTNSGNDLSLQHWGNLSMLIDSDNNDSGTRQFLIGRNSQDASTASKIALFSENGDISFYEDTGTTAKFFWDASTERLGVGTSSPNALLDVASNSSPTVRISNTRSDSNWDVDPVFGALEFYSSDASGSGPSVRASVKAEAFTAFGNATDLVFRNGDALGVEQENLRIDYLGRVGIGTSSPSTTLEVNSGSSNEVAQFISTDTTAYLSIKDSTTSSDVNGIGTIGDQIVIWGGGTERMRIDSAGNVGIGTASPSEKLNVSGNILATGNITAYSDERLKSDIETLDGSKVYQMRGVSYTKDGQASSGVIAQELQKVAPELVSESGEYLSVAYGNLVGYLIEAVKELKAEVEALKGEK